MSSATLRARSGLLLVRTWKVMPTSGTSDQGKPKKKFTNRSGSRASHVRACCTRFIQGEAPVHWNTVAEMIGTFCVTWGGTQMPRGGGGRRGGGGARRGSRRAVG